MRLLENDKYQHLQSGKKLLIYYLEAYMSGPVERRAWGLKPPPQHFWKSILTRIK